jgi:dipeptide/tripeptide permease
MAQPIDFGQFYNFWYCGLSAVGVGCIVGLIYFFGLTTIFKGKDKTRKNKRMAKKAAPSKRK